MRLALTLTVTLILKHNNVQTNKMTSFFEKVNKCHLFHMAILRDVVLLRMVFGLTVL